MPEQVTKQQVLESGSGATLGFGSFDSNTPKKTPAWRKPKINSLSASS